MARPRYSAQKRQREMKKKMERERKLARKHNRRAAAAGEAAQPAEIVETAVAEGDAGEPGREPEST